MVIILQTNESIKKSKHYDSEDAVCVPSEQNRSVRLYRSKNFVELKKKESKVPQISLIPHVLLKTSPAESLRKKTRKRPSNLELFYETKMISNYLRDNPGNQCSHIKIS